MSNGKVYLVGAGPGDPGLMTVKGLECLRKADVVVYDRLASDQLLEEVPSGAERIYVGKRPDRHTLPQEEINELLVDRASKGLLVVRLKGGDPYVFGRGGEEAETLRQAGIAFEVVPGITSAIAVPAYAGIPVTHRDFASSFSVVTGHERPDREDTAINWEHLALATDTLIFLMGVANLPRIVRRLVDHGRPASTPVALIQWGTRAEQRTVTGTLDNIVERVRAEGIGSPAITLVGEVVQLRDTLNWFEHKPLFGKRVVVTRARSQASRLTAELVDLGADVLELPVIEILEPTEAEKAGLTTTLCEIDDYDWIVFTSANAVRSVFAVLQTDGFDVRQWAGLRIAAVGSATARELTGHGVKPDFVPQRYSAAHVLEGLKPHIEEGTRVLLPRSDIAHPDLPDGLRKLGAHVVEIDAYRTAPRFDRAPQLVKYLRDGRIDAVTFTSSSTVDNFLENLRQGLGSASREDSDGEAVAELLQGIVLASIGPKTSETARQRGLTITCQAEEASIDALVQTVLGALNAQS